ncbi:hypothetical protein DFH09DRAFT_1081706 [Mycena vulgaris]|nr:hypothetical protein DFH09DRAFT_1081706 [Mycena vulgaris]
MQRNATKSVTRWSEETEAGALRETACDARRVATKCKLNESEVGWIVERVRMSLIPRAYSRSSPSPRRYEFESEFRVGTAGSVSSRAINTSNPVRRRVRMVASESGFTGRTGECFGVVCGVEMRDAHWVALRIRCDADWLNHRLVAWERRTRRRIDTRHGRRTSLKFETDRFGLVEEHPSTETTAGPESDGEGEQSCTARRRAHRQRRRAQNMGGFGAQAVADELDEDAQQLERRGDEGVASDIAEGRARERGCAAGRARRACSRRLTSSRYRGRESRCSGWDGAQKAGGLRVRGDLEHCRRYLDITNRRMLIACNESAVAVQPWDENAGHAEKMSS